MSHRIYSRRQGLSFMGACWKIATYAALFMIHLCLLGQQSRSDEVLYDYTNNFGSGGFVIRRSEIGQSVVLDAPSKLTRITIAAQSGPAFEVVNDVEFTLYDRERGFPNEMIWSGIIENMSFTRTSKLYSIDVPEIEVPKSFFYSVRLIDADYSITFHASPAGGNFGNFGPLFSRFDGGWERYLGGGDPRLAAKLEGVVAVPEPVSVIMLTAMGICSSCGLYRRRL